MPPLLTITSLQNNVRRSKNSGPRAGLDWGLSTSSVAALG